MKRLFDRKTNWIWLPKPSTRRQNTYACFRRSFNIKGSARSGAVLQITADSRYEVYINGQWLGHGPTRAFPSLWPVDRYEIQHLLVPGKNVVAVMVHHFGLSTFQYLPSDPGLIAQIDYRDSSGSKRLGTDRSWKCVEHEGYAYAVPRISCMQGWEEQLDARVEPGAPENWSTIDFKDAKWKPARVVENSPHPKLEPRAIPFYTREVAEPVAVRAIEAVHCANYSFNINPRAFVNARDLSANHFRANMLLATWIDSPVDQAIELHPPHHRPNVQWKLNGELLAFSDRSLQRTDTGVAHARLNAGKNLLLAALPTTEHIYWGILNIWTETPVTFSSDPKRKSKIPFLAFGPFKNPKPHVFDTISIDPDPEFPGATQELYAATWDRGDLTEDDLAQPFARPMMPHMVASADIYATCASERVLADLQPQIENPTALLQDNGDWTTIHPIKNQKSKIKNPSVRLLLDFGREVIGYHEFEIDAPEGAILDDHNFEFIQRDGRFNLAEGMNNSFRYVCREGVQRYRTFIRRGFRYSWLSFRNFNRPIRVRFVRAIFSTYPQTHAGEFACSDDKLTAIWNIGVHSVRCCSEDTYTDCPTYEQTFWVGDARNEAMVDLVANGDPRLSAHALRLAGRSLDRSPIIESQVPSGWQNLLPTWSFLWMRWAQEHFQLTGDIGFAREILDFVERNVRGIESHLNDRGLFQMHAWNLFDWAGMDTPAGGIVTHINCFAVLGLRQCADLATQLGQLDRAQHWTKLADSLAAAINRHLWSQEKQAYVDCIRPDGSLSKVFSQQTQTAAYISGVAGDGNDGDGGRARRCSEILYHPPEGFITTGSPFFMFFLLEALVREDRYAELIETIRSYWGQQIDAGATAFWEMFHPDKERLTRSHCHGWSAAPVVFLTQYILGVRPLAPGYEQILIAPQPGPLTWAHGRVPTPVGVIECHWKNSPAAFDLRITGAAHHAVRIQLPCPGQIKIHQGQATIVSPQVVTVSAEQRTRPVQLSVQRS